MFTANGHALKNNCVVDFPEVLNLDPFCTTGALSAKSRESMSPSSPAFDSSDSPSRARYRYRLSSLVMHYGEHSYGHYVTFRKRRNTSDEWYRASDETIIESSIYDVLNSNPFLLFYELDRDESSNGQAGPQAVEQRIVQRSDCEESIRNVAL